MLAEASCLREQWAIQAASSRVGPWYIKGAVGVTPKQGTHWRSSACELSPFKIAHGRETQDTDCVSQEILVEALRFKHRWLPWIVYPLFNSKVIVFWKKKKKRKRITFIELGARYFVYQPYSCSRQTGEHSTACVFSKNGKRCLIYKGWEKCVKDLTDWLTGQCKLLISVLNVHAVVGASIHPRRGGGWSECDL